MRCSPQLLLICGLSYGHGNEKEQKSLLSPGTYPDKHRQGSGHRTMAPPRGASPVARSRLLGQGERRARCLPARLFSLDSRVILPKYEAYQRHGRADYREHSFGPDELRLKHRPYSNQD